MTSLHPHPELEPLLVKYELSWEDFSRKGRPPKEVRFRRSCVVTELHRSGLSWKAMMKVTGLSLMGIQRLTEAVGCEAAKTNKSRNAVRVATARKGEKKPWLSDALKADWATGKFDFHRGRRRSAVERAKLKTASQRPDVKAKRSVAAKRRWQDPKQREALLAFHQSKEQRALRSAAQSQRLIDDPVKWTRGKGSHITTRKCTKSCIWVRSSYERAAVLRVEADPTVLSFEYEPRFGVDEGQHWIVPDFLLHSLDGEVLVEVKAVWVLTLPFEHKVRQRLRLAERLALGHGWQFAVWTEKDLEEWLIAEKN